LFGYDYNEKRHDLSANKKLSEHCKHNEKLSKRNGLQRQQRERHRCRKDLQGESASYIF